MLLNFLKSMTHSEDIIRVSSLEMENYLFARIQALEKRIEYLEIQLEREKHNNLYNN